MIRPTISQARKLCGELKARAVIIIALDRDNFQCASYGETKRECAQTGRTVDQIAEAIETGRIRGWDGRVR